jgi:multidrug resistance efflux pump
MAIRFNRLPDAAPPPPVIPAPPPARRSGRLLWLLAAAVVLVALILWQWNSRWISTTGTVRAVESRLAPVESVRIRALRVAEGEFVATGQTLVEFHDETLERAIALAAARVRLFEEAAVAASGGGARESGAGVDDGIRDTELALAQARARQAEAARRVRAAGRALELARAHADEVTRLVLGGAATRGELEAALAAVERRQSEAAAAALALRVDELGVERAGRRLAAKRRAGNDTRAPASAGGPDEARLAALALADLEARRGDYGLSLPHGGRVSSIHRRPGEVARTGEVILTVEDPSQVWLETYLTYAQLASVENGTPVEIVMPDGGVAQGRLSLTWNEKIAPWEEIEVGRRQARTPQQLPKAYRPVRVELQRAADAAVLQSAIGRMIRLRIARS